MVIKKIRKVVPSRRQLETFLGRCVIRNSGIVPRLSTKTGVALYKRWGMRFDGTPNYISSKAWFDGTDFSLITVCEGATISSETSFLTHDWTVYNTGRALGVEVTAVSLDRSIHIGPYSFIGRGSIVMPGSCIGRAAVVGAGSVVRGEVPDFAVVVGNPAEVVGDAREHFRKHRHRLTSGKASS